MSDTKRIFLAVNIPPEIKEKIFNSLSKKIPEEQCSVVKPENLHFTILFLGYFPEENILALKEKLQALEFKKFKIKIFGVGHFRGRVIWLGAEEGKKELEELSRTVQGLIEIKDDKISAHLTLARNKSLQREEVDRLIEKLNAENFSAEFSAGSLDLMESDLKSSGPKYKKIFSFSFR